MSTLHPETHLDHHRSPLLALGLASAVGVVGASALKLDEYMGARSLPLEDSGNPEMIVHPVPRGRKTLAIFGGLCMGTREVVERYHSQLADNVNLVAPLYPNSRFKAEAIFDATLDAIDETEPDEVIIAGLSMGGILGWDMLEHGIKRGRAETIEKVSAMIVRGTPFGTKALRPLPRIALNVVGHHASSYVLDRGRPVVQKWGTQSIVEAPFPRLAGECAYILGKHAGTLDIMPRRVIQIRGVHPDPFIHEDRSKRILEKRLKKHVEVIPDAGCQHITHMPTDRRTAHFMLSQLGIAK